LPSGRQLFHFRMFLSAFKMFKSKVIIVTGSSTGIGAGTAVKFASEGAAGVTLHGRKEDALKKVKEQCEKAGKGTTKVHIVVGDITNQDVREKLVKETVKQFGRLDVLVNNAGISPKAATFLEAKIETYDQIFDINVRSLVVLTQLAVPHLIESKGNIVNISSGASLKALPTYHFYCMSKAALDHFTRCLAVDLGPKGVRVNSVNPGAVPETELATRQGWDPEVLKGFAKQGEQQYPLRRSGTVDEMADGILYLASDKAKFITGVILPVDGGAVIV